MKIISYNVNGIRAAMKKGLVEWLKAANPDIIAFQEIKASEEQIDKFSFIEAGYPYQYWFPAQKKGYSGVAILCKTEPRHVKVGTGIEYMDREGRNLQVDYDDFSLMSLYLPSGTSDDRLAFKLHYMDDFLEYVKKLLDEYPNLIISGDYNICHKPIDIHDPIRLKNVSGFLPVEREWLSKFIETGFIDTFRMFNHQPHQYSWWSYRARARERNKGWRLDYHMASKPLKNRIKRAAILSEARHSDHCPVLVELK